MSAVSTVKILNSNVELEKCEDEQYDNKTAAKRLRSDLVFSYSANDENAQSIIPLNFRQLTKIYLLFKGIHFYWNDRQRSTLDSFMNKFKQDEGLFSALIELNQNRKIDVGKDHLRADANCSSITLFHHTSICPRVGGHFSVYDGIRNRISKEGVIVVLLAEGKAVDSCNWKDEQEVAIPGFIFAHEVIGFVHQLNYELHSYIKNPSFTGNDKEAWPIARREKDIEQMQLGISSGFIR